MSVPSDAKLFVRGWTKFQHYKDRNPPWIKLATDTFQNYEFSCLPDASKLLAICIWTLAARSKDGSFPADFEYIKRQCNLGPTVCRENLQVLVNKGFVEDRSNLLASCKQSAIPEGEKEGETEGETKSHSRKTPRARTLPDEFIPNDAHIALSEAEGINLRVEFQKFCDYCKANNKRYTDWDAALRNWIRRSVEMSGTRQPSLLPRRPVMR